MSNPNANNTVGWKSFAVGCGPFIGCPTNLIPLCGKGWQRKNSAGDAGFCYPASNIAICFFPLAVFCCYPIDEPGRELPSNSSVGGLAF
jgi:hypothetical protein